MCFWRRWGFWKRLLSIVAFLYTLGFVLVYSLSITQNHGGIKSRNRQNRIEVIDLETEPPGKYGNEDNLNHDASNQKQSEELDIDLEELEFHPRQKSLQRDHNNFTINDHQAFVLSDSILNSAAQQKCSEDFKIDTYTKPVTMLHNVLIDPLKTSHSSRDRGESLDFHRVLQNRYVKCRKIPECQQRSYGATKLEQK